MGRRKTIHWNELSEKYKAAYRLETSVGGVQHDRPFVSGNSIVTFIMYDIKSCLLAVRCMKNIAVESEPRKKLFLENKSTMVYTEWGTGDG